jgi:hypothetical protein
MLAVLFLVNLLSEFFLHFQTSGTCGLTWCALNYPVSLKTLLYTLWNRWQLHPLLAMTWVRANLQVRRMWWSSVLPNFLSLFHVMERRCRAHLAMKYSMRQFAIKLWESQGSKKQASSRQVVHRWSQHQFSAQLSCILSSGKQFSTCEHKANESLTTDWLSDRTQVSLTLTEHMKREDGVGENWCASMLLRWWRHVDLCLCALIAFVRAIRSAKRGLLLSLGPWSLGFCTGNAELRGLTLWWSLAMLGGAAVSCVTIIVCASAITGHSLVASEVRMSEEACGLGACSLTRSASWR